MSPGKALWVMVWTVVLVLVWVFFFFLLFRAALGHMEAPRLGVESEL